ncbi:MAG: hypothetical protein GF320_14180 [Armatimonadia bacterium]|nr:hypothetical protein [Armatimonadia bacterium]
METGNMELARRILMQNTNRLEHMALRAYCEDVALALTNLSFEAWISSDPQIRPCIRGGSPGIETCHECDTGHPERCTATRRLAELDREEIGGTLLTMPMEIDYLDDVLPRLVHGGDVALAAENRRKWHEVMLYAAECIAAGYEKESIEAALMVTDSMAADQALSPMAPRPTVYIPSSHPRFTEGRSIDDYQDPPVSEYEG